MRIGKKFIRNYVTEQLRVYNDYMDVERIDVIVNGKLLGYACADYEGIYYMWKEDGEYARDKREASRTLRKWVRAWVRNVTDAIYARGLEHEDFLYYDRKAMENALDEELKDYCQASEISVRNSCRLHYDEMVDDLDLDTSITDLQLRRYAGEAVSDLL